MKIICFMYASFDGRIDCAMTEKIDPEANAYYAHLASFGDFTQINGKTTNAMHYAQSGVFEAKNYCACGESFFQVGSRGWLSGLHGHKRNSALELKPR